MKEVKYKVLWIDDEKDCDMFIDRARDTYKIDIHQEFYYSKGIEYLSKNLSLIDAAILDVNCKKDNDDAPNMDSFLENLKKIDKLCRKQELIPWFVFTGGGYEGFPALLQVIKVMEKQWDEKKPYYEKSKEADVLMKTITTEADKRETTTLRLRYSKLFKVDEKIGGNLLNIIKFLELKDERNAEIFTEIRAALETLRHKMVISCILPEELNEGIKISRAARFIVMSDMQKIIPQYIQRCYHSSVMISSEATHNGKRKNDEEDYGWMDLEITPKARIDVQEGRAPYLFASVATSFMTFLYWLSSLDNNEDELKSRREIMEKAYQKYKDSGSDYNGKIFKIEKDENGILHCGDCEVPQGPASQYFGKKVRLIDVKPNTNDNKDKYPYFAKFNKLNNNQ